MSKGRLSSVTLPTFIPTRYLDHEVACGAFPSRFAACSSKKYRLDEYQLIRYLSGSPLHLRLLSSWIDVD